MPTPTVEHFKIEIEEDFMARQTRAEPVHALAELIWNSWMPMQLA